MGQSFMRPRNAHLKLHRDGTTCLEMTLGPRRIELQADVPNETYLQAAAPLASILRERPGGGALAVRGGRR